MANEEFTDPEEKEADVYGNEAREDLAENDEISPEEGAFMEGYEKNEDDEDKVENEKYEKAFEGDSAKTEEEEEEDDGEFEDEY